MAESDFKPIEVLAGYLKDADPDKAVKLVRELCAQLEADPDSFHGGIWPGNVDLDVDGKAVLGPGSRVKPQERSAEQVEYMSPEYFLDGETSAAADVYSIGLMLYAACNDGFLPFQPKKADLTDQERADALRRRMKGEPIPMPEGISEELAKILEKTLAYEPDKRYITSSEFLSSLNRTDEALPTAAAVGAAAVAGAAAAGKGKEDPMPEPAEDIPQEPEAAEAPGEPEIDVSGAGDVGIETAAAAAGGTGAGGETYAPRREYRVQKDFEKTPRAKRSPSTVPAAQRKRKKSGAVPVLAALAALALLGGAGYMIMKGGGDPTVSQPFVAATTAPTDEPDATPVVITPKPEKEPERTPKATEDPEQTPEASPETEPTPIPADAGTAAPTVTPDMSLPAGTAISAGGGSGASGTGSSIGTVTSGSGGTTGSSGSTSTTGSTGASGSGGSSGSSGGSSGSSGSSTGVTPADGTVYLTGNLVRVRTGPGTGYSIIGHVSKGDSLVRTGTTANGWTQVNYNGRTGYVSSKYLTTTNPNATAAPTATPLPPPVASPDYQVVQEKANYAAALNEDLATVGSENDFTAITKALDDAGVTGGAWVGATYENGKWLWSDGTEFSAADKAHTDTSSPVEGGGVILIKDGDTWVYRAVDKTGEYAYVTTG